ncbi:MAG TPA: ACP phosphodiesterase [Ferruginibacter sp.]|nr:ACP phosphodiesterase [Ferruginibacter sp.]
MNFLAHAHLSFYHPEFLLGNMVSDFVKGKKQYDFPVLIQKGIRLHRAIDAFTDIHPATREIKKFFQPAYRLYSGGFTDIAYDYFLANDENEFANENALQEFCRETYRLLEIHKEWQPSQFSMMFPYMKTQNWLFNYRFDAGIEKSFAGMTHRARYINESRTALEIFLKHKAAMQEMYHSFYPSVKNFAALTFEQMLAE